MLACYLIYFMNIALANLAWAQRFSFGLSGRVLGKDRCMEMN